MSRDDEFTEYAGARQQRLYRQAYLLCGDPDKAQDLVQSTLLAPRSVELRMTLLANRLEPMPDAVAAVVVRGRRDVRRRRVAAGLGLTACAGLAVAAVGVIQPGSTARVAGPPDSFRRHIAAELSGLLPAGSGRSPR